MFTKVFHPLIWKRRGEGIKMSVYIDDGLGIAGSKVTAQSQSDHVKNDLHSAGFKDQTEKPGWKVTQRKKWLGFILDLNLFCLSIPESKIQGTRELIQAMMSWKRVSARELSRVAGKVLSFRLVLGDVCAILTKALYAEVAQRTRDSGDWDEKKAMGASSREELRFWAQCLAYVKPRFLERERDRIELEVFSDA